MQLTIISGLSGAGKSVALHTLEDEGYYCIDNLPNSMLVDLAAKMSQDPKVYDRVAVVVDARGQIELLGQFRSYITQVQSLGVETKVVFLDAHNDTLVTRFSETRRKHPLSQSGAPLGTAIVAERSMLVAVEQCADVSIDTTNLNLHQLREVMRKRVIGLNRQPVNVLLQSFGFKHGPPYGTDFIFDVRFLQQHTVVNKMADDISKFFLDWTPVFESENRAYLTISVGCTGGRHRSVYIVETVRDKIKSKIDQISVKHREIS